MAAGGAASGPLGPIAVDTINRTGRAGAELSVRQLRIARCPAVCCRNYNSPGPGLGAVPTGRRARPPCRPVRKLTIYGTKLGVADFLLSGGAGTWETRPLCFHGNGAVPYADSTSTAHSALGPVAPRRVLTVHRANVCVAILSLGWRSNAGCAAVGRLLEYRPRMSRNAPTARDSAGTPNAPITVGAVNRTRICTTCGCLPRISHARSTRSTIDHCL